MRRDVGRFTLALDAATRDTEDPEIGKPQRYLTRYRVLGEDDLAGQVRRPTAEALKTFQQVMGLEATGELDAKTAEALETPRCATQTWVSSLRPSWVRQRASCCAVAAIRTPASHSDSSMGPPTSRAHKSARRHECLRDLGLSALRCPVHRACIRRRRLRDRLVRGRSRRQERVRRCRQHAGARVLPAAVRERARFGVATMWM
jgi:Putative peptidoglycan binding domain